MLEVCPHMAPALVAWERHLIGLLCRTGRPLSHEREALHRAAWSTVMDWGGDLGTSGVDVASRVSRDGRRPTDSRLLHPGLSLSFGGRQGCTGPALPGSMGSVLGSYRESVLPLLALVQSALFLLSEEH